MKKFVASAVAAFALLSAAPAFAQDAAPAPADPAATVAVQQMFDAMNYRQLMSGVMQQMARNMPAMMRAAAEGSVNNNPRLTDQQKADALAKIEARLPGAVKSVQSFLSDPAIIDEILAETVPLYARAFSADEIHQITAFYRTPVGAKLLATTPQLMSEGMQLGQKVVSRRLTPLLQQLQQQDDDAK